jgi:hypothetical protein
MSLQIGDASREDGQQNRRPHSQSRRRVSIV